MGLQLIESARRRGLGGKAIDLLEHYFARSYPEVSGLTAYIDKTNTRSVLLFKCLGYKISDK